MTTPKNSPRAHGRNRPDSARPNENAPSDEVFDPPRAELSIAGRDLTITPITLGEMPAFSRAARPVFEFMRDMAGSGGENFLFDLFEMHTAEMADLMAVGARVDAAWILSLSLDDAARVGDAVVKLNQDFFIRRLLPLIRTVLAAGGKTTGATP